VLAGAVLGYLSGPRSLVTDNSRGFGKRSRFGMAATAKNEAFWMVPQVDIKSAPCPSLKTTTKKTETSLSGNNVSEQKHRWGNLDLTMFQPGTSLVNDVSGQKSVFFLTMFQEKNIVAFSTGLRNIGEATSL
jgi:hypothetical protein